MSETSRLLEWLGHTVVDRSGRALGPVGAIYLDARSDLPKWVLVTRERSRLVPLKGATTSDDRIHVGFDTAEVEAAPDLQADDDLGPDEETRLLRHYQVPVSDEGIDLSPPRPAARGATRLAPAPHAPRRPESAPPTEPPAPTHPAPPLQPEAASAAQPEPALTGQEPALTDRRGPVLAGQEPALADQTGPALTGQEPALADLGGPALAADEPPPLAIDLEAAPPNRPARRSLRSLVRSSVGRNPLGLALATAGTGFLAGLLREPAQRALQQGLERLGQMDAKRDERAAAQPDRPAPSA